MLNRSASLDQTFQALADSPRRAMVERLCRGPASVSELAGPLTMSFPAVMQHLAVLEGVGLVHSEKAGRVRTCRLNAAALAQAERWISQRRTSGIAALAHLGFGSEVQDASQLEIDELDHR